MRITATMDTPATSPARPAVMRRKELFAADRYWAAAFATPYAAVFLVFVVYPIGYGLWLGSDPASYRALFADPIYPRTVTNTLLYLLFGVNLKLALALLLSGFFMRKGWWFKILLLAFMLPWAIPALPSYLSINWMLNGQWGLINNIIWLLFQVDGPPWLDSPNLALGAVIYGHIWKWLPFWTLIFLAGRMAIPFELYEAADVDGASRVQKFAHVTMPLTRHVVAASGWLVLVGLGVAMQLSTTNGFLQTTAPDHLRGRAVSMYIWLFSAVPEFEIDHFRPDRVGGPGEGSLLGHFIPFSLHKRGNP